MRDALESWVVTLTRRTRALTVHVPAICVGGSLLGGTGKTPLAIAIAKLVASRGVRVALVGHAYHAAPERARVVRPDDDVRVVGDEALVCARALDGIATVVVAPDRQHALDLAASLANVLVVDGVLQLHPRRAALSVLTVPPTSPPPRTLARVADVVVQVATTMRSPVPWEVLRKERVGLITSLARPERVLRALAMHHVVPVVHIALPNHGRHAPGQTRPTPGVHVDRWLATDKCAHHLAHLAPRDHTSERTTLSCEADLSEGLEARVAAALRLDPVERAPYSQSTPVFPVVSA